MGFGLQSPTKASSHVCMISQAGLLYFLNCLLYFQLLSEKTVHEAQFRHMKSTRGGKRFWGCVISEGLYCVHSCPFPCLQMSERASLGNVQEFLTSLHLPSY